METKKFVQIAVVIGAMAGAGLFGYRLRMIHEQGAWQEQQQEEAPPEPVAALPAQPAESGPAQPELTDAEPEIPPAAAEAEPQEAKAPLPTLKNQDKPRQPQAPLFWCSSRVRAMRFSDVGIKQEDRNWIKERSKAPVPFIEIEKWLAQYCQVPIDAVFDSNMSASFQRYFQVDLVDGRRQTFERASKGLFRFKKKVFFSGTLEQGFRELRKIIGAGS